jgi:transcriptional regulator with XRE-family HTH domain
MLGKRLTKLRKEVGLIQQQLADELYISRDTYAQYEIDRRSPDYETLTKIADYFHVSTDYLIGRTDVRSVVHSENASVTKKDVDGAALAALKELGGIDEKILRKIVKETVMEAFEADKKGR